MHLKYNQEFQFTSLKIDKASRQNNVMAISHLSNPSKQHDLSDFQEHSTKQQQNRIHIIFTCMWKTYKIIFWVIKNVS